ncbi:MAG: deoxyuridine 5'-triphosphate nucleotidohydrolase, partial [Clostridia bacterium]|nr:deoxyuridine 5'-triphosphate nucleotidohydrolase [Clostridia bacterium]
MKRIAQFEKVSYEQFASDWTDTFGSGYNIEEIYNTIKLPKRATTGSAGYD